MAVYNAKTVKKCAFCKYWWDPACSLIEPVAPKANKWEIKKREKRMCIKTNLNTLSDYVCAGYECKLKEYLN